VALKRIAVAISMVACATSLSFGWSEQHGVSLRIETVQAADSRLPPPVGAAGVARRHYRQPLYGHGLFAEAIASTTSPWNYDDYVCYGDPNAGRGYPPGSYYYDAYPGGTCVSSGYLNGTYARPLLAPRYYGGW
jgi:hypothetical protein